MLAEDDVARVLRIAPLARDPLVWRVVIQGGGTFRLDADIARRLGVEAGGLLDARTLAHVRRAAVRQEARHIALRLLQRRLRSRVELERALKRRKMPAEAILSVCAELRRTGWLDDARFARVWIEDRLTQRPCGARRLQAELRARGVARPIAEEAVAALLPRTVEDDLATRQAVGQWRRLRRYPPAVARRRLAAWLQRRGFRGEVIARVLRSPSVGAVLDDPDVDPAA